MTTHLFIDRRNLQLAQVLVSKIDINPDAGVKKAQEVCTRWKKSGHNGTIDEWLAILSHPWNVIKSILLDPSENGCRLRQSNPFCGILSPQERWTIYRSFKENEPS
jgi:hypothetical protein